MWRCEEREDYFKKTNVGSEREDAIWIIPRARNAIRAPWCSKSLTKLGAASRVAGLDGLADGVNSLSENNSARGTFVAAAKHTLAKDARHATNNVAHGLKLRAGDLVDIAQAVAIFAEDGADAGNVAPLPSLGFGWCREGRR